MVSFLYQLPEGVVGDVTRPDETNVEPAMLITPFPTAYGIPMKYATGGITEMAASDAATVFAGILVRAAPGISGSSSNEVFNQFTPNSAETQGLLIRGYCSIICTIGTPARGGVVYVRVVAASGKNVGDFEATADGSNNVAITSLAWAVDGKDANNITEVRMFH